MKIGVIGGSVAGLTAAIQLQRLGMEVTVFERSENNLSSRGAGIVLPEELVQACIKLNLFDHNIPRIPATARSFTTQKGKRIFDQPLSIVGLNWGNIYANLRKRLPEQCYRKGESVVAFSQRNDECHVITDKDKLYDFDYLIGADGVDSVVRKSLYPESSPQYAGYVAWRGTTVLSPLMNQKIFQNHVAYFVFPKGHILIYSIPSLDYAQTGNRILNWVLFEESKDRQFSLPPGTLTQENLIHLRTFAHRVLPKDIADIIVQTKVPFMQAIYDGSAVEPVKQRVCLIGDSAAVLRPHSVSGVLKALKDGISLAEAFATASLEKWNAQQVDGLKQQVKLSVSMGKGLVTNTPDWETMTPELMEQWWKNILAGETWYATPTQVEPKKPLTYVFDKESAGKTTTVAATVPVKISEKKQNFKAKL